MITQLTIEVDRIMHEYLVWVADDRDPTATKLFDKIDQVWDKAPEHDNDHIAELVLDPDDVINLRRWMTEEVPNTVQVPMPAKYQASVNRLNKLLAGDSEKADQEPKDAELPAKCPFCKCELCFVESDEFGYFVQCKGCYAQGPIVRNRAEAISKWNIKHEETIGGNHD